jgi:hypothetical protein
MGDPGFSVDDLAFVSPVSDLLLAVMTISAIVSMLRFRSALADHQWRASNAAVRSLTAAVSASIPPHLATWMLWGSNTRSGW